jgi:hypothetical protein
MSSNFLTGALALNSLLLAGSPALGQTDNRCVADLSRVDPNFCLKEVDAERGYTWAVNDDRYTLTSKVCLDAGDGIGNHRDLVLALDRSQSLWGPDTANKKLGADGISTARHIITKLQAKAKANPAAAPKISVMMFSTASDCREYAGAGIAVNREFPCLYVQGGSVGDDAHVDRLLNFLKAAEGKYSQGGLERSSDYRIAADLAASDRLGMTSLAKTGLILFSDGRSYSGANDDVYAYLRSGAYAKAQNEARAALDAPALAARYRMVFALSPLATPVYDGIHADAYDNMCAIAGADPVDCDTAKVTYAQPSTWPVNNIDVKSYALSLVEKLGGDEKSVITMSAKEDIDAGLEILRVGADEGATIESVGYSIDGAPAIAGLVEGSRVKIIDVPVKGTAKIDLLVKSNGAERRFPLNIAMKKIKNDGKELVDQEMFCAVAAATPKLNLNNLQGGAGSCGVVNGAMNDTNVLGLIVVLAMPLLAVFAFAGFGWRLVFGVAIATVMISGSQNAFAEESAGGLNALQYRPVVGGVAASEKADTIGTGQMNAGLFMDYSNDAVELGGEKNKRVDSIMDDLVTAHAVANVGLASRLSLGVHVPFVHKSDVDRSVTGEEVEGGQLGRPSDIAIGLKINILRRSGYSLGLMPMGTVPTGEPELLLGDGSANYGAMFLVSGTEGQFNWAFNMGYLQRQEALVLTDDRANEIIVRGQGLFTSAGDYRVSQLVSFGGHLQFKFSAGEGLDLTRSSPAEWMAQATLRPMLGLELTAGFGTGLGKGYGAPDYRAMAGVAYVPSAQAYARRVATK